MTGIQDTREVIVAVAALAGALRTAAADGLDILDVTALIADARVRTSLLAAALGIKNVPVEMADLNFAEIRVLVDDAMGVVAAVIGDESAEG